MPYMDVINTHARNNRFEYDHKSIYKQVRQAMKKQGEARDQALKAVLESVYRKEAVRYEAMRQQFIANLYSMTNANEAARLDEVKKNMAHPAQFLEQMAEIVGEMAKDVDRRYHPEKMLGLKLQDAKNLVRFQLSSYTRLDETMYSLRYFGWADAHRALANLVTDNMTGKPRKFATADEVNFVEADVEHRSAMYEAYIRKEELKNQLNSKGFFWKLRHRSEVREMRNYIEAAETALTAVGFPQEAIGEAKAEFAFTAARKREYEFAHSYFDKKFYVAPTEVENLLGEKTDEEIEEILNQKADYEDRMIEKINAREAQQKLDEQNKQAEIMASFKKPTNRAEIKRAFSNKTVTRVITKQFVALMEKATNTNASKESKANSVHTLLGVVVGEAWADPKNMHTHAIKFFKTAYSAIKYDTPDMSVAEKLVAAQKMANIMLSTYSPAATNPSLAQYNDNYGIQKMNVENIKELTGFKGDINELMDSVKTELGIGKEKVDFGNEFGEVANDKSAKVEEHKAPVVENVKQS